MDESGASSHDARDEDEDDDYEEAHSGNRLLGFMFGNVDGSGDLDVDYLDEDAKEHIAALADKLDPSLTDIHIHSKKRNRLDKKRLNDLVFVKYNRALKHRYDMRDVLDPISLKNIDESNEWLLGRMDRESDEDDEFVFDDDILTWGDVATASGVGESSQRSRATSTSRATPRGSRSSTVLQLVDEEEAGSEETDEEDVDGYKSNNEEEDYDLLGVDVEDDC